MNIRAFAAKIIYDVVTYGRSLNDVLSDSLMQVKDPRDRALLQAICYGVCRWYFKLNAYTQLLLEKPLKKKDFDIQALLLVGLYQLIDMRIPDYAAITETVSATKYFKKIWAKGLVNGVLRQYQRRADELKKTIESMKDFSRKSEQAQIDSFEVIYSHPKWMIEKLQQEYPDDWEAILNANNQHPPFALRINQQRLTREEYVKKLSGMNFQIIPETQSGIILTDALDVEELPGFLEGEISVQDGAAQLAAELLLLESHHRVLDACAAPGGKTAHILEQQPTIDCIAVDHDPVRLTSVTDNLARLKLSATCVAADVADTQNWWDGKLFDRILLDAPCSATGVVRRHPDIKLLRQAEDIDKLADTQLRLLNALWPLLKPSGILLYATCSIFPEENVKVLQKFMADHPDVKEEKIVESWGKDCQVGKQILPGMHGMDGFYFARLRK